jgi:hypothetical protein
MIVDEYRSLLVCVGSKLDSGAGKAMRKVLRDAGAVTDGGLAAAAKPASAANAEAAAPCSRRRRFISV